MDAGYNSDPHTGRSQTGYVFLLNGTAFSWKSTKQTMATPSTTHAELLALHEASREAVWLRSIVKHIRTSCGLSMQHDDPPTVIYEDNANVITAMEKGYVKGDRTKHIDPKFFYTHELRGTAINVVKIAGEDNTADIFTKPLGPILHWKHVRGLGMRRYRDFFEEEI